MFSPWWCVVVAEFNQLEYRASIAPLRFQMNSRNSLAAAFYLALALLISLIICLAITCTCFFVMAEAMPSQADDELS